MAPVHLLREFDAVGGRKSPLGVPTDTHTPLVKSGAQRPTTTPTGSRPSRCFIANAKFWMYKRCTGPSSRLVVGHSGD